MQELNTIDKRITSGWGFLKSPAEEVYGEILHWEKDMRPQRVGISVNSDMLKIMRQFQTGTDWPILIAETNSPWTAIFWGAGWPESIIGYVSKLKKWEGLLISHVDDTVDKDGELGQPGGTQMIFFGGADADEDLYVSRCISATRQTSGWSFELSGKPLPFEDIDSYAKRSVRERFDQKKLQEYCRHLNIELFSLSFYGPKFWIIADEGSPSIDWLS